MDIAVALVETYLRVNGYFTVSEYPVLESVGGQGYREATDLDMLAFRFPHAGRLVPGAASAGLRLRFEPDPALGCPEDRADMLICEIKQGQARLNPAMRDPNVLRVALVRFGCCDPSEAGAVIERLLGSGRARGHSGHRVRLMSFGSEVGATKRSSVATELSLDHVIRFLEDHLRQHWPVLHHAQFRDPALAFLALRQKAVRGVESKSE